MDRGQRVLVRGFRDEPGLGCVWAIEEAALVVSKVDAFARWQATGIEPTAGAYKLRDVFEGDETLYTRLRSAFESRDHEMLQSLWAEARRFKLPKSN